MEFKNGNVMMAERLKIFWRMVERVFRRAAPIAGGAYLVVALFGLTFLFVKSRWPGLENITVIVIAVLVAAPLGIALLWPRLSGVKAFGVELSLTASSVQTNAELVGAITGQQYYSGSEHIIEQMRSVIVSGDTEILEINLRDGNYWWSTRLYLLAALVNDYSNVQAFTFVECGVERKFLGIVRPASIQKGLAKAFPALPQIYSELTVNARANPNPDQRMTQIVMTWAARLFDGKSEDEFGGKVSPQKLTDWLNGAGQQMLTDSIEWTGVNDSHLVRGIVFDYRGSHVALLRNGRLDRIVNRFALVNRIAEQALSS